MTEPREPEAVPDGEPAPEGQPTIPTSPGTGNWYPVSAQPESEVPTVPEEAVVEPVISTVPEEVGEERADRHEGPSESVEPEVPAAPEEADAEPVISTVPEEVGEERADRHEEPSESVEPAVATAPEEADAEPVISTVPEEVGEERADRHEGPSDPVEPEVPAVPEEVAVESEVALVAGDVAVEPEVPAAPEEADAEPVIPTVPEEVGEERADRHEGPSEPVEPAVATAPEEADAEPVVSTVPEEVGEERADRHEGPSGDLEPVVSGEPEEAGNDEATVALPGPGFVVPAAAATEQLSVAEEPSSAPTPPADGIFRQPSPPSPGAEPTTMEPLSEEEQKLAAERAARRDARVAALAAPAPEPAAPPKPVVIHKRTNDRFWGSLGLFLVRIVLAGIFTIRGLGILTDIPAAQAEFAKTILADYPPGPQVMAIITGVGSLLIALSLVLGLLTRVAGLGIALIAGGALALVYWGPWSIFVQGQSGFLGEYQLLLAAMGILLLFVGGGGWSLDRSFRAGRERDKRERAAEPQ